VDSFRQKMFRLRDDMFDDAVSGRISFNEPAYGMLRFTMNGAIRFAHMFSFLQFLFFVLRGPPSHETRHFAQRFGEHLNSLSAEKQKVYKDYAARMNRLLLRHLLLGSPIVVVTVVVPIVFWVAIRWCVDQVLTIVSAPMDEMDTLAFTAGDDDAGNESAPVSA
jgi:hypothetical protein